MAKIKTRLLILSDTHAAAPITAVDASPLAPGYRDPLPEADVVLHCGDLTRRSTPAEYATTFSVLRSIRAPLKLAIAGNHDTLLDDSFSSSRKQRSSDGKVQQIRQLIDAARQDGVQYLTEGSYVFTLHNGALLRVYASQYTPIFGGWGFQYCRKTGHSFDVPPGVDVAMTHGPPFGILDEARASGHVGCEHLFRAVACARPRLHCFGHIHEAWGAYHCTWNDHPEKSADSLSTVEHCVNRSRSRFIQTLDGLETSPPPEARVELVDLGRQHGIHLDVSQGATLVEQNKQTLFVNAAIMDVRYRPSQLPWIVDIDLPSSRAED